METKSKVGGSALNELLLLVAALLLIELLHQGPQILGAIRDGVRLAIRLLLAANHTRELVVLAPLVLLKKRTAAERKSTLTMRNDIDGNSKVEEAYQEKHRKMTNSTIFY